MTTSITRLTKLLRFERGAPGGPAKAIRWSVGVALCTLALLAAVPASAPADPPASPPVHSVKGDGVFFLEAGAAQGGNLILQYSINASVDRAGKAHGYISSTIDWVSVPPPGGHPDPFGTGGSALFMVTDLVVVGNYAFIGVVVVFAPDFPEVVGSTHYFEVVDNGGPPNSGDTLSFDGFDLPPIAAGNFIVR